MRPGIIQKTSRLSVNETVDRLLEILRAKGVTLVALVDHSGEAAKAGFKMRPTKLLIFGSPKAGTPVMQSCWYGGRGKVRFGFRTTIPLTFRNATAFRRS